MNISLAFRPPVKMNIVSDAFPADACVPGIYIWGFMIDNSFVPYYVGKAQGAIAKRIQQHRKDIFKEDSTYVRLNKAYMEGPVPFYCDPHYPLVTSAPDRHKLPAWMRQKEEHFLERIDYLGNRTFLEMKYGEVVTSAIKGRDYPINTIPQRIDDYLTSNDIFVTYSPYDLAAEQDMSFYGVLEAYVKYALKGKTGSASLSLRKVLSKCGNCNFTVADLTGFNLFKNEISDHFPGYR